MKRIAITATSLLTACVLSSMAFAQGRHDEKPHGSMKAAPATAEQPAVAGTGGRHDEGGSSHGKRKPAAKKQAKKKPAAKAQTDGDDATTTK